MTELLTAPPRVDRVRAGHVGAAIARAAAAAGFRVCGRRPAEFAGCVTFRRRVAVVCAGVDEALALHALTPADAVVIATRGHRHDAVILSKSRVARTLHRVAGQQAQESGDYESVLTAGVRKQRSIA